MNLELELQMLGENQRPLFYETLFMLYPNFIEGIFGK